MTLIYSETLFYLYRTSAGWSFVFYLTLALFSLVYKDTLKGSFTYMFIYVMGAFLFELSLLVLSIFFDVENNLFILHPYLVFGFILVGLFYLKISSNYLVNRILTSVIAFACIVTIGLFFYEQGYEERPKLAWVYSLVFLIVSLFVHSQLVRNPNISTLKKEPLFWFNTAFLIYTGYALIFSVLNPLVVKSSDDLAFILGIIGNIIEPIYLLLLGMGVLKLKTTPNPIQSV